MNEKARQVFELIYKDITVQHVYTAQYFLL